MITLSMQDHSIIEPKLIQFSDGAINVELPASIKQPIGINWHVSNVALEMIELEYIQDALEELGLEMPKTLFMPYLPNARADRVFNKGNAKPLEHFLWFLSQFGFDEVVCYDLHSSKAKFFALLNHINLIEQSQASVLLDQFAPKLKGSIIVAPDKGASEKAQQIADRLNTDCIQVEKVRCLDTGRIKSVDVPVLDYSGLTMTIVDDIADGSGTFIPIAEQLKAMGAKEVNLCITHGIFSKGLKILEKDVDNIFVANIVGEYITTQCIQKFNLRKGK